MFVKFLSVALVACNFADITPKTYDISLDEDSETRWSVPVTDYLDDLLYAFYWLTNIYAPLPVYLSARELAKDYYDNYMIEPYKSEIQGISNVCGLDVYNLTAVNIIYDISAFCTSIVTKQPNGQILHGRNLDYPMPPFRNITININMMQNNELVFNAVTEVGYIGIWTGVRPSAFSLSGDQRFAGSLEENIDAILIENYYPSGWYIRDVLTNEKSYNNAYNNLINMFIQAPVYYILGGMTGNEGAVITRNQTDAVNVMNLEDSPYQWYVLETNFDSWEPACDTRRQTAINCLNNVTQANINPQTLQSCLYTWPVRNNKTQYTALMSASDTNVWSSTICDTCDTMKMAPETGAC